MPVIEKKKHTKTQTHLSGKVTSTALVCIYLDDSLGQSFSPG